MELDVSGATFQSLHVEAPKRRLPPLSMTEPAFQCQACLGDSIGYVAGKSDHRLVKCAACGLVTTTPMPSEESLRNFYQGFSFEPPDLAELKTCLPVIVKSLEFHVGPPIKGDRFLDYGGGYGIYCLAAKSLGWRADLFDYDVGCLDFARKFMHVEMATSEFQELEPHSYDVIFAFHVIEHWSEIKANMITLKTLLKPGGRIVIATPNCESLEKFARPRHLLNYIRQLIDLGESFPRALWLTMRLKSYLCWNSPRHLHAFNSKSLLEIGHNHGFKADTKIGYNDDPIYEPRGYIISTPTAGRASWPPDSPIRRIVKFYTYVAMRILRSLFPTRGEQLYGFFEALQTDSLEETSDGNKQTNSET